MVFSAATANGTDAWFGDHRAWTVRVPLGELQPGGRGALGYLADLPGPLVARLHRNVQAARLRLQYARHGGTPGGDALDTIVRRLGAAFQEARHHERGDLASARSYVCDAQAAAYNTWNEPKTLRAEPPWHTADAPFPAEIA